MGLKMDIPKYKGKNLQSCISDNGLEISDPQNPNEKYIKSDKSIMNIEDMK